MTEPGVVADSSARALTAQLDEVWSELESLGRSLTDAEWSLPTPCPGWPVSAQYAHVIGTESMLLGRPSPATEPGRPPGGSAPAPGGSAPAPGGSAPAPGGSTGATSSHATSSHASPPHVRNDIGKFNEAWVAALAGLSRTEVLDRLAEVTAARREMLSKMTEEDFSAPSWTPVGKADYRRFMQIRVFDCWVHEQDVRDATGRPGHEAGPAAEQSIDEIVRALGYIVGKKAAAPDGVSVRFELTGPLARRVDVAVVEGRARVVDSLAGVPTCELRLPASVFARLACGRIDPAVVAAAAAGAGSAGGAGSGAGALAVAGGGRVDLAGDEPLGRRILENLPFTI